MPLTLSLHDITRRFGGVIALDKASFELRQGTVHALLGENGAGKTTLMRVAFGLVQPDSGTIAVNDVARQFASPNGALAAGIGMVHQHFTLVPAMTVAENVALGSHGRFRPAEWSARVRDIGARTGLAIDPDARVAGLAVGAQQRAEVIKALSRNVDVLILDEPTAVLAPAEAHDLLQWMRAFADSGHSVVLITHKLRDAMVVADDVTVLRRGRTVLQTRVADTTEPALVAAMLGDARTSQPPPQVRNRAVADRAREPAPLEAQPVDTPPGDVGSDRDRFVVAGADASGAHVVRVDNATVIDVRGVTRLHGASLSVRAGETLGIAAIEGAGQRELLRVVAGRLTVSSGAVQLPTSIGFVPEDRHADALLLDATLVENVALRDAGSRRGRMPWATLAGQTQSIITGYSVRAGGVFARARTLSGGNQQKLVIGRELAGNPALLVVENPTRGLDIRAAESVHDALRRARAAGAAVVVYSSDLDEVLALADRVLVVNAGRVIEVARDRERIGEAMLGATPTMATPAILSPETGP
jgi:ABC-type uncharacterized transport system ATPase subunit